MSRASQYLPLTWKPKMDHEMVPRGTPEFNSVCESVNLSYVTSIKRVQNENRYYMFLARQQHIKQLNKDTPVYVVRRYVSVSKKKLADALKYNLDSRRTSFDYNFKKTVDYSMSCIMVVLMITLNYDEQEIFPARDSDFYIEYIIKL